MVYYRMRKKQTRSDSDTFTICYRVTSGAVERLDALIAGHTEFGRLPPSRHEVARKLMLDGLSNAKPKEGRG